MTAPNLRRQDPNRIETIRTLHRGWLGLELATVRLDDGTATRREIVDHPCGTAVLVYHPARRTARVVSELRAPVEWLGEPRLLEAVSGKVEGDDPAACARREVLEEVGVAVRQLEPVGRLWITPCSSTERVDFFLAAYTDADCIGAGGGLTEDQETLAVEDVPLRRLWPVAESGDCVDMKLFLLLQALKLRQPDLFG